MNSTYHNGRTFVESIPIRCVQEARFSTGIMNTAMPWIRKVKLAVREPWLKEDIIRLRSGWNIHIFYIQRTCIMPLTPSAPGPGTVILGFQTFAKFPARV